MRAAVYNGAGGPEVIELRELPAPEPGPDEVLVAVSHAGLNRSDLVEREGRYGPRDGPAVPGLEFAGTVAAAGSRVREVRIGSRVMGIVAGGAHAEYLCTHAGAVAAMPEALSFERAAAIPEAFITAHDALLSQAAFHLGQTVLIHAVGSSIGLAALQLVRHGGGRAIGTSRSRTKLARAAALGLEHALLLDDDFPARVAEVTGGRGVDVILDFLGGAVLEQNLAALACGGRIIQIGLLTGARSTIDLGVLMAKRAALRGTMLRTRALDEKIALTRGFATHLVPLFAAGALSATVDRVFALDELAAAHRYMEEGKNFGKIVIAVSARTA